MNINIAPTKANLMSAKTSLEFSQKGYELLDKKRNVLIREMMQLIERAEKTQSKIDETFTEAYKCLQIANMTEGTELVSSVSKTVDEIEDFQVLLKSVMGVEIPNIKYKRNEIKPTYGFYRTNNAFDMAVKGFQNVKYLIYELAEIECSVYRLAMEIKKTQKRTNALENIQIPKYKEIVKYIKDTLEEKEREDFFRLKKVKKRRK